MPASIPFHDFGGHGPLIHFSHSNGYPPECFQRVINHLLPHFRVIAIRHRALWPGSEPEELENWHLIADDLIRFFYQQGISNVIGMGHSSGAVATMYASLKRPDLFQSLILLDPVFLPQEVLTMVAANPGLRDEMPLVKRTPKRRNRWPSRQAAYDQFRPKSVFKHWPDATLWDYVNCALEQDESGDVVLAYSREWETQLYRTMPLDVWDLVPQMTHPTLALRGAESDTLMPASWQLWQNLQPKAEFVQVAGTGHMLLMEQPEHVADIILNYLRQRKAA